VVLVACEPEFVPAAAAPALGSVAVLELELELFGTAVVPPAFGVVVASGVAVVLPVPVAEELPALLEFVWLLTPEAEFWLASGVVDVEPWVAEVLPWLAELPELFMSLEEPVLWF
jgi:hypothetical protein